jgi:hypothetical protein
MKKFKLEKFSFQREGWKIFTIRAHTTNDDDDDDEWVAVVMNKEGKEIKNPRKVSEGGVKRQVAWWKKATFCFLTFLLSLLLTYSTAELIDATIGWPIFDFFVIVLKNFEFSAKLIHF